MNRDCLFISPPRSLVPAESGQILNSARSLLLLMIGHAEGEPVEREIAALIACDIDDADAQIGI